MTEKGISIIVCCYNSENRIPKTLEYLAKQTIVRTIPVELIIVNNASTDCTKEIVLKVWEQYQTNFLFRLIYEEKQGIIFARERGVQESKYEYVLFCDDDNWLQSDYLQKAFDLMESNARIGALGGQSIAVSNVDFPEWFSDFESDYAVGKQSNDSGDVSKRGFLWGAGMITRRAVLNKVFDRKYPHLLSGRTGYKLMSGDDTEICKRILFLGYMLYYDNSLIFFHYMPPNRLTWAYKKNLCEGHKASIAIQKKYDLVYIEMNKNFIKKMMGILYNILKYMKPGNSTIHLKNELYAKTGCLFKSGKISKDSDYKIIIGFFLENNKNKVLNKKRFRAL